jgi:hypothetical protein
VGKNREPRGRLIKIADREEAVFPKNSVIFVLEAWMANANKEQRERVASQSKRPEPDTGGAV